ncbi:class I adenylate-forming enzyme family protein [Mycolicibacterium sp. CBMA 226]|uniref:class I adenylate-forming enzyme family protein n=1 Tax=Mycolicibacterium sp. CBMA 226 TaxID=2606611 RepID=UPI0012DEBCD4|nr:class I adenylate-forming enzyme family protein [Mycolicibacterium sp. CBMA 226]MUL74503.1 acyl--CoA ligase [Mycolicibacterium sp. CBMA 226]
MALDFETLAGALDNAAEKWGTKPFIRHGTDTTSYAELRDESNRIAAGLLARGLRPGDRIAIASQNRIEWLSMFFAAMKIGLPVVLLSTRYRDVELRYMLNHAEVRMVVTANEADGFDFVAFYDSLRKETSSLTDIVFLDGPGFEGSVQFGELATEIDKSNLEGAAEAVTPSSPAVIAYTSGTTGTPKGASLTNRNLLTTVESMTNLLGINERDVFVGSLPLSHVGGVICGPLGTLLGGAELVLLPVFHPVGALEIVDQAKATVFFGAPTMYSLMLDRADGYDITTLRHIVIGTSNAPPALCERIVTALPKAQLWNIYGLTEASGFAIATRAEDDLQTIMTTIGAPMGHVEARVVDESGAPVGAGEVGELQLRGAGVCDGYWRSPEQTAASFLPGGWLATGDAVELRSDGYFSIRGRVKEMFTRGGFNVYPVEIENLLATHSGVAMAAGIGVPDPVLGEVGRYFVVAQDGEPEPTPEELKALCRNRVADYKIPDQIILVDALPLTPLGKINKRALKELEIDESQKH